VVFVFWGDLALGTIGLLAQLYLGPYNEELAAEVTDDSFKREVEESKLPVLVDFWAIWCGPCRMYAPTVEKIARDYQGKLKVVRVDVDKNPNLSRNYQIRAIPTTLLLHNGAVVKSWVGMVSEGDLKDGVEQVLKPLHNVAASQR
jgi:thioredoxin 1